MGRQSYQFHNKNDSLNSEHGWIIKYTGTDGKYLINYTPIQDKPR